MNVLWLKTQGFQYFKTPLSWSVLLVLIIAGYFFFGQFSQLQQLKSIHLAQIDRLRELKQDLAKYPDIEIQQQQDLAKLNQIVALMAEPDQTTKVAMILSNQLIQSGLQIKLFQPRLAQSPVQLINFQLSGSYRQLINFLQANSASWPINVIDELSIVPESNASTRLLISGVSRVCWIVDKASPATTC